MANSNSYPKPNRDWGGSRPPNPARRPIKPYRPTRPFQWSPPIKEPGKFPGMPRGAKPFGQRVPLPYTTSPVMGRLTFPLGRIALRAFPWIGLGLMAWDLWKLYQEGFSQEPEFVCRSDTGKPIKFIWGPAACGTYYEFPQPQEWSTGNPRLARAEEWYDPGLGTFYRILDSKEYAAGDPAIPVDPNAPPINIIYPPPVSPVPILPWIPIAVPPLSPQPLPIPKPPFVPTFPNPEPTPGPVFPPVVVVPGTPTNPGIDLGVMPGIPALPRPFPARRPPRGTKERKMKATAGQRRLIGALTSLASEGFDLLDALHDALPKKLQGKDHPKAKFEALYRNWDKVDMNEAFENIWRDQVEDRYYGEQFEKLQETFSQFGLDFASIKNIFGNTTGFK